MKRTAWTALAAVAVVAAAYSLNNRPFPHSISTEPGAAFEQTRFIANVDPTTGEFVEQPVDLSQPPPKLSDESLSRSTEGLVEETAPVGGGVMVDLQGRFQNIYSATLDAEGTLRAECDSQGTDEATQTDGEEE